MKVKHFFALVIAFTSSFIASIILYVWLDYPRGNDAISHVFRLKVVLDFFPNFSWVHTWAGGMPLFRFYPLLPYLFMAIVQKLTGLSIFAVPTLSFVLSMGLAAFAMYLLVFSLTKSWRIGILSSLMYLTTPAVWGLAASGGLYSRAIAIPFVILSVWASLNLWLINNKNKRFYFLSVIFITLAVLSHPTIGIITAGAVFVLGFLLSLNILDGLKKVISLFIPALLMSAWFWVLFVVQGVSRQNAPIPEDFAVRMTHLLTPFSKFFFLFDASKVPVESTNFLSSGHWLTFSPFLLPFFICLLLVFLLLFRSRISGTNLRLLIYFSLISLFFFVYSSIFVIFFKSLYYSIGGPNIGLSLFPIFIIPANAILLTNLLKRNFVKQIAGLFLIVSVGAWFYIQYGVIWRNENVPYIKEQSMTGHVVDFIDGIIPDKNQFNYRIGDSDDDGSLAAWLNIVYPLTPQTRDYFFQGIVDKDFYSYKDVAIWHTNDNYGETDFLLDWWGVQQVMTSRSGDVKDKFEGKPNYKKLGQHLTINAYRFANSRPLLSATNSTSVLIIGRNAHNFIFRDLAYGNVGSQMVVPVNGGDFVDDFSLEYLQKMDIVFLYEYKFHDQLKAQDLLLKYVTNGGRLVIESNFSFEKESELSDPFPVGQVERGEVFGKWEFDTVGDDLKEERFADFSPFVYENGPWGVSFARNLKSWAKTLLSWKDKPVLVAGTLGKGRVVWSGLNLPFHVISFHNEQEALFLTSIILGRKPELPEIEQGVSEKQPDIYNTNFYYFDKNQVAELHKGMDREFEGNDYTVEFINPQKRIVTLKSQKRGILFKEFYMPNWTANLIRGKTTEKLTVFKAGPNFMYIPLTNSQAGDRVILSYRLTAVEKLLIIMSSVTFLILVFFLFDKKGRLDSLQSQILSPFDKIKSWWGKDEEGDL